MIIGFSVICTVVGDALFAWAFWRFVIRPISDRHRRKLDDQRDLITRRLGG